MTQREVAEPTRNQYGDEVHPAFGRIQASRVSVSSPGSVLFDSDIRHGHTVVVRIHQASRKRDLGQDWIHDGKELIEVEMSEAQWASFVSSMNTSGVPCTLRSTESDRLVPELSYDPRLAHSMQEVKDAAVKQFGKIRKARDAYEKALEEKAPAKERTQALRNLHFAIENSGADMTFSAKSLVEHAENVVQKARADIEAMVAQEAGRLGLTAGEAQGLLELPVLEGEAVDTGTPEDEAEVVEWGPRYVKVDGKLQLRDGEVQE